MSRRVHRGPPPTDAREIPGFNGLYFATPDGQIWSHWSQRFLSLGTSRKDGYLNVGVSLEGRTVNRKVHRLVCAAFHGEPAADMEANHKDLIKTNNLESNLEWLTRSQNGKHAWSNLPAEKTAWMRERCAVNFKTTNHRKRKLSPEDLDKVRVMLKRGDTHSRIAAEVGIGRSAISTFSRGETYRDQA